MNAGCLTGSPTVEKNLLEHYHKALFSQSRERCELCPQTNHQALYNCRSWKYRELPSLQMHTQMLYYSLFTTHWTQRQRQGITCQLQMQQESGDAVLWWSKVANQSSPSSPAQILIQQQTSEQLHIKSSCQGKIISKGSHSNTSVNRLSQDKQLSHETHCIVGLPLKGAEEAAEKIHISFTLLFTRLKFTKVYTPCLMVYL